MLTPWLWPECCVGITGVSVSLWPQAAEETISLYIHCQSTYCLFPCQWQSQALSDSRGETQAKYTSILLCPTTHPLFSFSLSLHHSESPLSSSLKTLYFFLPWVLLAPRWSLGNQWSGEATRLFNSPWHSFLSLSLSPSLSLSLSPSLPLSLSTSLHPLPPSFSHSLPHLAPFLPCSGEGSEPWSVAKNPPSPLTKKGSKC